MSHSQRLAACIVAALLALGLGAAPASAAGMNLHRGSTGARVKTLETRLHQLGLLHRSQVDRRFRASTSRAVKRFQRKMHIRASGRVNRRVWNLIAREARRRTSYKPPAAKPKPKPAPPASPLILGHRGARVPGITENTMAALRYSADHADILEFDLQLTADDEFVLMHDYTLDRTTSCTGPVAAQTLEHLRSSCPTDNGSGPIPTFAEAAAFAASAGKAIAPEVKDKANVIPDEVFSEFVGVVRDNGLGARTYVQSFHPTVFPRLRALDSELVFVYLADSSVPPSVVRSSGAAVAGLSLPGLTAEKVTRFRDAGLPVWAWTAVSSAQLQSLRNLRVAGVFTDIPEVARDLYH